MDKLQKDKAVADKILSSRYGVSEESQAIFREINNLKLQIASLHGDLHVGVPVSPQGSVEYLDQEVAAVMSEIQNVYTGVENPNDMHPSQVMAEMYGPNAVSEMLSNIYLKLEDLESRVAVLEVP